MTKYLEKEVTRGDVIRDCMRNEFVIKDIFVVMSSGAASILEGMQERGEKPEIFFGDGGDIIITVPKER
jgi:hypothetical protein